MNWEGFLKGVSDYGLERLKEERHLKMQKDLEELKEKYTIAAENRKHKRDSSAIASENTIEKYDPATGTGTITERGSHGDVLFERDMTPGEIAAKRAVEEKAALDNENIRDQMKHRTEQIAVQREGIAAQREGHRLAAASRASGSSGGIETAGDPVESMVGELLGSYDFSKLGGENALQPEAMGRIRNMARQAIRETPRGQPGMVFEIFDNKMSVFEAQK